MNIFVTTRRLLQFSGFIPFECSNSLMLNFAHNVIVVVICVLAIISMALFTVNDYKSKGSLDFLYIVVTAYSIMCVHMNLMWKKPQIIKFINDLEVIITDRIQISSQLGQIYKQADEYSEMLSKWSTVLSAVCAIVFVSQWTLSSLWIVLSKSHSVGELILPYPLL